MESSRPSPSIDNVAVPATALARLIAEVSQRGPSQAAGRYNRTYNRHNR